MSDPYQIVEDALAQHGCDPKRGNATCPAHDDSDPSLAYSRGKKGGAVVHCHAGCGFEDIVDALDLKPGDLFVDDKPKRNRMELDTTYLYLDANGDKYMRVRRYRTDTGKTFRQDRYENNNWQSGLAGRDPILYQLPEVLEAAKNGDEIWVAEGEKCVAALGTLGVTATCNPGGAGKFRDNMADAFQGAERVNICADKDTTGGRHALDIADACETRDIPYRLLVAGHGHDAADHIYTHSLGLDAFIETSRDELTTGTGETDDNTGDLLERIVAGERFNDDDYETVGLDPSWIPANLGDVLDGALSTPTPDLLHFDGSETEQLRALMYSGRVNGVHGDSGIGKSMIGAYMAAQELIAGDAVLWLDYEDPNASALVDRLRMMRVPDEAIRDRLIYLTPRAEAGPASFELLAGLHQQHGYTLAVVDSVGEAFGVEGVNEDRDDEVAPWIRNVIRPLAELGPGVLLIDHSTKAKDNPLYPSGSKRKRAAIQGSAWLVTSSQPPTRETGGKIGLTCAKDRHGHYKAGQYVGALEISDPFPDGRRTVKLRRHIGDADDNADAGDLLLVKRVVDVVKAERPENLSQNAVETLVRTSGASASKTRMRGAIELAVLRGFLGVEEGPRGSKQYHFVSDFDPDKMTAPDCAATAPGAITGNEETTAPLRPVLRPGVDAVDSTTESDLPTFDLDAAQSEPAATT